MAYNTKYYYQFASCNGKTVEIDVKQNGYSGSATLRRVGGAPVLRMEANDCIHGMSLELPAECINEDEYADLYSTDPYLFQVDVNVDNSTVWKGFVTPELYSAPWIDPPYDVIVTATDGLGELKLHNFAPMGRTSLYSILSTLLGYTGLSFAINAVSTAANGASTDSTMLTNTYVSLDHMAGESCYDVLQALLTSLHATIQQVDCAWLLIRETDVNDSAGSTYVRDTSGNYYDIVNITSMADSDCWPVGQLRMEIQPAKNRVDVTCPNHPHQNYISDPNMVQDTWGNSYCTHHDEDGGFYEIPPSNLAGIYQSIRSVPTPIAGASDGNFADLTLHVKARQTDTQAKHRIKILIQAYGRKLGTSNTYASFWFCNDFGPTSDNVSPVANWVEDTNNRYYITELNEASVGNSADCTELDINIKFPELVRSCLALDNNYAYLSVRFSAYDNVVCVHEATLSASTTYSGMSTALVLNNSARGAFGGVESAFADSYTYNYGRGFIDNICRNSGGAHIANWSSDALPSLPYGEFIAKDYAFSCAMPRLRLQGRLNVQTDWMPLFLRTNSMMFQTEQWSFDLLNDEVDVSILSLPAASLQVTSVTTTPLGTADAFSDLSTAVAPTSFNVLAGDTSEHYISISQVNSTSWSVSGYDSSWITFSSTSGSGTRTIYFTLSENSGEARSSTFTIAGMPVQINQEAGAFSFTPTTATASEDNGSVPITISCGASQAWSLSSSATWCTVNGSTIHNGTGPGTVYLSYGMNVTSTNRTATITVYKGSTAAGTITLTQAGVGSVSITSSLNVGPVGNAYTISVTDSNNIGWRLTSNQSWCTVSPSSGTGSATNITVTIGSNTSTTASRTATITCTPTTGSASTCYVYQSTATAVSVTPSTITFDPYGSTETVSITGDYTEWSLISSPSWCVESAIGGNVDFVDFTAGANNGSSTRSGQIIISVDGTRYTVNVSQAVASATTYTFTITPTPNDATVTINGSTRTSYSCPAGTNITWSVAKTGYVTQTGTYTMGSSNYTLAVTLSTVANYTFTIVPTPSDATVTINGSTRTSYSCPAGTSITWSVAKTGYTTQTGSYTMGAADYSLPVTLDYSSYSLSVTPTTASFTYDAYGYDGGATLLIEGNDSWNLTKPSWCTVYGNVTSGTCPAYIRVYPTDQNTSGTARTGAVTITGAHGATATVSVTQAALSYEIVGEPNPSIGVTSVYVTDPVVSVNWSVVTGASICTTSESDGSFYVTPNENAQVDDTILIRATSTLDNTRYEELELTVSEGVVGSGYFDMPETMTFTSLSVLNYINCVPVNIDTSTVAVTKSDPDGVVSFAQWYSGSQKLGFGKSSSANLNVDHTWTFTVTGTDMDGVTVTQTVTCYYTTG